MEIYNIACRKNNNRYFLNNVRHYLKKVGYYFYDKPYSFLRKIWGAKFTVLKWQNLLLIKDLLSLF